MYRKIKEIPRRDVVRFTLRDASSMMETIGHQLRGPVALTVCLLLSAVARAQLPTPTYGWNLGNTLEASDMANNLGLKPFYWDTPGGFFDWTSGALLDPDNVVAVTGGPAVPPP